MRKKCFVSMLLISVIVILPIASTAAEISSYKQCFSKLDPLIITSTKKNLMGPKRNPLVGCPETHLFMEIKAYGDYNDPGDSFVVKATVTNIGDYNAFYIFLRLENIPDDWVVHPSYHFICWLRPGGSVTRCFGVVRGEDDATIHGCAWALNAKKVISNKIPIPISPLVLLSLLLVFAAFYVHRRRKR
jgi:hypothetical protein